MEQERDPELVAVIAKALDRLPGLQREIFLAVRHEQATYSVLSARFDISVAQVEQAFADALTSLVRAVDGE